VSAERKWRRVLAALVQRASLHRFDAERDPAIRDHTLPSTIADLQKKGLRIDRELVELPGYGGGVAHVARYSLDAENRQRAITLLNECS
jgi:hypothetical protein